MYLKKIFLSIVILLNIQILLSQNYFEFTDSLTIRQSVNSVIETETEKYVVAVRRSIEINQDYFTELIKLNQFGEVENQLILADDSLNILISDLFDFNGFFIGITGVNNKSNDKSYLRFYRISDDLDLLEEKTVFLSDLKVSNVKIRITEQGEYLVVGNLDGLSIPFTAHLDGDGNLLKKNIEHDFLNLVSDIMEDPFTNGYIVYGNFRMYYLDSIFQDLYYEPYSPSNNYSVAQQGNMLRLSADKILLTGKYSELGNDFERDQYIGITDNNFNELIYTRIGKPDTIDFPAFFNSVDFIDPNSIFYGGVSNIQIIGGDPIVQEDIYYNLSKLDSNLNIIWTRYFGGQYNDTMFGITATSDGGCIMFGWRYNGNTESRWDAYVLKVNAEGELTFTTEIPLSNSFKLYPNPTKGILNIENTNSTSEQLSFLLTDVSGRTVLEKSFGESETIDISHLGSGLYFYSLKNKQGVIRYNGKVVRE